jgi:hypothetical protein
MEIETKATGKILFNKGLFERMILADMCDHGSVGNRTRGNSAVSRATGLARTVIYVALKELDSPGIVPLEIGLGRPEEEGKTWHISILVFTGSLKTW